MKTRPSLLSNLMRDFAKMAGDAGVKLAVKAARRPGDLQCRHRFAPDEEVTEQAIGLNFDPSHLARADDNPAEVAHAWGNKIITSHFRDCPVRVPARPEHPNSKFPDAARSTCREFAVAEKHRLCRPD
jgi:sugar phosphate isomerase/epimerase